MKNVKILLLVLVMAVAVTAAFTGCQKEVTVEVAGSTSVQPLAEKVIEQFTAENKNIKVNYQGIGSSNGVKACIEGTAEIGTASRAIKDAEKAEGLEEYVICKDGIAVVVNPANTVESLTVEQVQKIFMGEIKNWNEVGGADKAIIVNNREAGSGTRGAFEEILKIEDKITKDALEHNANGTMRTNVSNQEEGIGYISFGYIDATVKTVKINDVAPTKENVINSTYPISRPFMMVTKGKAGKEAQKLIDYILGDKGQKIAEEEGYILVK